MKKSLKLLLTGVILTSLLPSLSANAQAKLRGKVSIDGSSTVFPITEAIAEEYRAVQPRVRVNIGVSGTGGGFKKFLVKETDINNASRNIKDKEVKKAKKNGISYVEVPVAYDGLTVVINKENSWASNLTPAQLKMIWDRDSKVKKWSDIDSSWPAKKIKLYGPGTDSGTFDYFTKAINGKSGRSRANYTKSEDDNVLVKGVAGDKYAMGYFGYAYYKENSKKLQSVAINNVKPTEVTINNGSYKPLSRPIFIYVSKDGYKKPEVKSFVGFYLEKAKEIVGDVGYIALKDIEYKKAKESLKTLEK
ncbi:MAG: PstS family phosphate ABC transporter substrate-binding protein [Bacteriovoracaceae bacterium]|nr:PstS family phosphate ABC transporter substrate-binding protein [Bacteriovoracaceae bacterium]